MLAKVIALLTLITGFGGFASFSAHTNLYFMLLSFLFSGIVFYLLDAVYLAIILFVVYIGAVAMLFVFCIILLNMSFTAQAAVSAGIYFPIYAVVYLIIFYCLFIFSMSLSSDFFALAISGQFFFEQDWSAYSTDQFLTYAVYGVHLPHLILLAFLLFFVTIGVTLVLGSTTHKN